MRTFNLLMIVVAGLLLSGCGKEAEVISSIVVTAPSLVHWTRFPDILGVVGNYTPWIITATDQIRVFANTLGGEVNGKLYRRDGTFRQVGEGIVCLDITEPRDHYIRTSAVAKGESGRCYALLHTGDGYPTQGGFSPSFAVSDDQGITWQWLGPCTTPFGRFQSDSATLIVDESRNDDYKFMSWETGTGKPLVLMHSADGLTWHSDKENMWPIAGESPTFPTAAKTPFGFHIIAADQWPAQHHRHIFSATGLAPWTIIESSSATRVDEKGTNLVYDPTTNQLHALTSGTHWVTDAKSYL